MTALHVDELWFVADLSDGDLVITGPAIDTVEPIGGLL